MKVVLSMAISANGMIATETGNEDFLSSENWIRLVKLTKKTKCLIWGRRTYEAVRKWDRSYFKDLEGITKIIISRSKIKLQEGFELTNSPEQALKILKDKGFKTALLSGGSTINSEFAKKELIDVIILDVNPSILGKGIPVFHAADFDLSLQLLKIQKIKDEILELTYKVKK